MTLSSFDASTKIHSRSPVRPSPDPVCSPGSSSPWTSPAASHRSLPILCTRRMATGSNTIPGPLKTTSLMRPRAALIKSSLPYTLCRIEDDSSLTPVSQHEDILTGIAAAGHAVEVEDLDFAYALYAGDPSNGSATTRVASFREGRIGYRMWATRSGRISPSVEDRLDHDVDELMA
jgi:hypothetical protein